jgi:serine/threonine-protein kinase ATR
LVGAFRSTSDIRYQSHLAYAIQELLSFCKFTPALVTTTGTASIPLKVRNRWSSLPEHVHETVTPLLGSRYALTMKPLSVPNHPIYPHQPTYREWIQLWTSHLITKASGETAQVIFGVCCSAARNKDVSVAHHLLPHLVLNILISGDAEDVRNIRSELLAVLEDQVSSESDSTADKRLLSAQACITSSPIYSMQLLTYLQHRPFSCFSII